MVCVLSSRRVTDHQDWSKYLKKVEITCGVPQEPFYVQYYFFFTIMIITANEKLCNLYDWLC